MEQDNIENEFKKVADEINAKIKEAGEALKAANKIAKEAGVAGRLGYDGEDYYDAQELTEEQEKIVSRVSFAPLFNQLDVAGWHTSSIGC